jgi:hypothetical protein
MKFFSNDKLAGSKLQQSLNLVGAMCSLCFVLLLLGYFPAFMYGEWTLPLVLCLWVGAALSFLFATPNTLSKAYRYWIKGEKDV